MLKRNLSSIAVRRFVTEVKCLAGSRFYKAYQLDYGTLVIRLNALREDLAGAEKNELSSHLLERTSDEGAGSDGGDGRYVKADLLISTEGFLFASPRIDREMPLEPSPYVMMLRKRLKNWVLEDISQLGLDRIVSLRFSGPGGAGMELITELFGDGNIILVSDGRIEAPLTSRSWSTRTIKRGEEYVPPPGGLDPTKLSPEEVNDLAGAWEDDVVRFLIRSLNLPPIYAEEVCFRSYIEKEAPLTKLSDAEKSSLYGFMREVIDEGERGHGVYVHYKGEEPLLVEPVLIRSFFDERDPGVILQRYGEEKRGRSSVRRMDSLSSAVEEVMFGSSPLPPGRKKEDREKAKLNRMLEDQVRALREREEESERFHRLADALYLRYQEVSDLLSGFDPALYSENTSSYPSVRSYVPKKDGPGGLIRVGIETAEGNEEVELDLDLDLNGNAENLYQRSKRSKRKLEGIKDAIERTEDRLEKRGRTADEAEKRLTPLRSFWFESFRWCYTSEGLLMLGGRDARSNEKLVKRYLRDSDIYSHADVQGASSVVLRVDKGQEAGESSLEESCHFSVLHSKAFKARIGSERGYWVEPGQVSRTPQTGEFLPKGSFMIRGKKNYFFKLDMVGAVGVHYVEGVPKAMFGPVRSVEANCRGTLFMIRPGEKKKTDAAKQIAGELGVELDQLLSVLPPGSISLERMAGKNE